MSQLLQLRAAVIEAIKSALPDFKVEGHLGRFSPADLTKFLTTAPAVRVAVLGLTDTVATGEDGEDIDGTARLAIYVVTRDVGTRASRDEVATAAVEKIVKLATGNRWGLSFAMQAKAPTAQNLFSDETLKNGVAMWAIDLPQPVQLWASEEVVEPIGSLKELYVGVAPNVGADHEDEYVGPIPEAAHG